MSAEAIVCTAACILYALVLISLPLREKKYRRISGSCLLSLSTPVSVKHYLVFAAGIPLIILPLFRDFGLFVNIILSLSGVAAAEIALRDLIFTRMAGVYEQSLIIDGRFLPYADIRSLPELAYADADTPKDELYERALKIVSETRGIIYVGFKDRAQKEEAVQYILQREPRLRP